METKMSVYSLDIKTGTKTGAGTDANVSVILYSTYGQSRSILLNPLVDKNIFESGKTDHVDLPDDIVDMGDIEVLHISHDNAHGNPGWYLENAVVTRTLPGGTVRKQTFPCNKWLAKDEGDKKIARLLNTSGETQSYPRLRPFYIIGHNPNTIDEVKKYLKAGANAIEPDVIVYKHDENQLCFSHSKGDKDAPSLVDFLKGLHQVAKDNPKLALVYFDIKPEAQKPDFVWSLREAVRTHLNTDGVKLFVTYTIAEIPDDDEDPFARIANDLHDNEALMIDEENDPEEVKSYFQRYPTLTNRCFGNGISFDFSGNEVYNIRGSIKKAVTMRESFCFIAVWTVNDKNDQKTYIDYGVDGILVDREFALWNDRGFFKNSGIRNLHTLVEQGHSGIRLATREDQAFGSFYKVSPEITLSNEKVDFTYGDKVDLSHLVLKTGFGANDPVSIPGNWEFAQDSFYIKDPSRFVPKAGNTKIFILFKPANSVHYNRATTTIEFNVAKANPKVVANGGTFIFDGKPHGGTGKATGVDSRALGITISYQGTTKAGDSYGPTADPPTVAGGYQVTVSTSGDENHNPGSNTAALTIQPAPAVVIAPEALEVREGHSTHTNNVGHWLKHGEKIDVWDVWRGEDEVWVQHDNSGQHGPGWSAMEYEGKTFVEFVAKVRRE
jgi:hypothetical protein